MLYIKAHESVTPVYQFHIVFSTEIAYMSSVAGLTCRDSHTKRTALLFLSLLYRFGKDTAKMPRMWPRS